MIEPEFYRLCSRFKVGDGCWDWEGHDDSGMGHGRISFEGQRTHPYRATYELLRGPIPEGLVIDHLCRNPRCVNPYHLEPVPNGENILRGEGPFAVNARRTECASGHPFDAENTYIRRNGNRACRACIRKASAEWKRKQKVIP